jgi:hypothetical protein
MLFHEVYVDLKKYKLRGVEASKKEAKYGVYNLSQMMKNVPNALAAINGKSTRLRFLSNSLRWLLLAPRQRDLH